MSSRKKSRSPSPSPRKPVRKSTTKTKSRKTKASPSLSPVIKKKTSKKRSDTKKGNVSDAKSDKKGRESKKSKKDLPEGLTWLEFRKAYREKKGGTSSNAEYAEEWEKYRKKHGYKISTRKKKSPSSKKSSTRKPTVKRSTKKKSTKKGNYSGFNTPSPCFPPIEGGKYQKVSESKDKTIQLSIHYYHRLMSKSGEREITHSFKEKHKSCTACLYYKDTGKLAVDPNSDEIKQLLKELKKFFKDIAKKISKSHPEYELAFKEVWFMSDVIGVSFDMKEFGSKGKILYDKVLEKINKYVDPEENRFTAPKEKEWFTIGPMRLSTCSYYE